MAATNQPESRNGKPVEPLALAQAVVNEWACFECEPDPTMEGDAADVLKLARALIDMHRERDAAKPSERGPTVITDPPGAAVEMFLRKNGRLPNKPGDGLDLLDRLELAAQACRAAHILSCEATCREAAEVIRAANRQKGEV